MMNYKKLFFILLLISKIVYAKDPPDWLINTNKVCKKDYICVTGNGRDLSSAKINAIINMQSIFEVKINSKFISNLSSNNGRTFEFNNESINIESEGVLNNVKVLETFFDKNVVYVFAVLNKHEFGKIIEKDINNIDKKINILISNNSIKSNFEIEKLYNKRQVLNSKYEFLTKNTIKENYDFNNIMKNNNNVINSLNFYITKNLDNIELYSIIKTNLLSNNLKITSDKENSNRVINYKIGIKKQYLNIVGFEKYKINFNLSIENKNKIVSNINVDFIETGTTYEQIYNKFIIDIRDYLSENFKEFIN